MPCDLYREHSEIVAINEDRDTAELDVNRARLELLGDLTRSTSSLREMERERILRAVRGGPNGTAARLGMKRTTLAYHIRKLNISLRPH